MDDELGRVHTETVVVDNQSLVRTYGYDRSGNVKWKQNATPDASGRDELYAYDEVYRLTNTQRGTLGFDGSGNPVISDETKYQDWTLDGLGNFAEFDDDGTPQTRTTNAANEIETITGGTVTPEYDAAGNMISGPSSTNASVRLHYVYDAWNRLVAVYADNNGSLGSLIAAYEYDGSNRRIEKTLPAGSTTDFYYNQQWQLLEERTTTGATTTTDQYVWDQSYIDSPIVRFHDGNNDGDCSPNAQDDPDDTVRYYTWDANHNVTTTITVDAAATTTVKHNVYDAYGKATVYSSDWSTSLGAPTENGPLYCGYMFDAETSNYLARNRYYSVVLATWICRDPIGYSGGISLYRYAADSPTIRADPSGQKDLTWDDVEWVNELPDDADAMILPYWKPHWWQNMPKCQSISDRSCPKCTEWVCTVSPKNVSIGTSYRLKMRKDRVLPNFGNANEILAHENAHRAISEAFAKATEFVMRAMIGFGTDCDKGKAMLKSRDDLDSKMRLAFSVGWYSMVATQLAFDFARERQA